MSKSKPTTQTKRAATSALLQIKNLQVRIADQEILKGVELAVEPGVIHAIMGPNGSGKSTLAHTLVGHPSYEITAGTIKLGPTELNDLSPDERAKLGLFLAFQYPVEIPGVKVHRFLKLAYEARFAEQPQRQLAALAFQQHLKSLAEELKVKTALLNRGLNEGFSGGEKKRLEILQMAVLEPRIGILDETDSGLDIDAIKAVAKGVMTIRDRYQTGLVVITHYQRILRYLTPDVVHIMHQGRIVKTGQADLAAYVEEHGYQEFLTPQGS